MRHQTSSSDDRGINGAIVDEIKSALGGAEWLLDYIEENFVPDNIFSDEELGEWATVHGYVLKEE